MKTQEKENKEKIETKELTSEIVPILKDCFVADVTQEEGGIKMTFLNGQTFLVEVRES